ncbi:unnamed protein product [Prunus armeniaca]
MRLASILREFGEEIRGLYLRWSLKLGDYGVEDLGLWKHEKSKEKQGMPNGVCGKLARMQTSWTSSNLGQRFLVCPKSKGGEGKCKHLSKVKNIVGCYVAFLVGGVCHEDELGTLAVVQ